LRDFCCQPNPPFQREGGSGVPPAPRDYSLEGFLLPAKSAVLAGFGGVSKTQLALQLVTALALGKSFMGKATKPGNVIMILGEEDREATRREPWPERP
jgi:hypothetical protein